MTARIEKSVDMQDYEQSVFISYAWGGESEEIVNQIDKALQQRGLKIIRDKRDLGYKGSISAFMERIGQGNCVILVISDKYLRSSNCMFELVEIAEGKQFHDRVFPIVLSNAEIYDPVKRLQYVKHWEGKLAELDKAMREVGQANLQGIREDIDQYSRIRDKVSGLTSILKDMNTLTSEIHRDSDFSEIYSGIEQRMAGALGQVKPKSGESPYMGLRYFDTPDANLFFGRETLTHELAERVSKESFLAIVGASGSGKSSVARAGLIPAWKSTTNGMVHIITPSAHPLESLAASLTRESESVMATSTLIDDISKDARSLRLYVRKLLSNSGESNLLIVVDQFEETFTLCKDVTERKAFIENLLSLADDDAERSAARLVITLRADFYHHCGAYEGLRLALEKHQAYIGAMTQDELRQAITMPAEKNGWDFQPRLVDLILRDVGMEPGALPLLSQALLKMWENRQGHTLTLQGYAEAGGVKQAIAKSAEDVYGKLSPAEQTIARNIFLRLTELGEGTQGTRRRVSLDELAQAKEQEAVAKVLKILVDARLVTVEQDSAEVAHEALIREWGTLHRWLDEDRENLQLHRHLTESAQEWERRGREVSELYRGTRLKRILEWNKAHSNQVSPLEARFMQESQNLRRKEATRWLVAVYIFMILLVAIYFIQQGTYNNLIYRPVDMKDYWVTIPAGEFEMGSVDGEDDEMPIHTPYINDFQIGRYEVTNRQYQQCLKAGSCIGGRFIEIHGDLHPVTLVSWEDASDFCKWVGGRLPTEGEWEYAARGGLEGKRYPWGNEEPTCEIDALNGTNFGRGCHEFYPPTMPVGSFLPNSYGLYDMAGNVSEWVSDWYSDTYYGESISTSPIGPEGGDNRVLRGGSWWDSSNDIRTSNRGWDDPDRKDPFIGFRCARDISVEATP
jgi:formylglycine-generating enzyme required for sulfatase activity